MKLSTAVALILSTLSFTMAYSSQTQVLSKEVVVKMPEFTYDLSVGKKITFELQENLGTGYSWIMAGNNDNVTMLVNKERIESGVPGSPDIIRFTFEAKHRGISEIIFELRRPWEKSTCPASRFFVFIQVK